MKPYFPRGYRDRALTLASPRCENLFRRLVRAGGVAFVFVATSTLAAGPSTGHSPTPLAPNGPCRYGFSTISTVIAGVSRVVGMM